MKDLIKKILKEETSDLKPALIRAFYGFMEMEMGGYNIYVDTPENRFEHTPESIWIINPKTKGWIIELENSGNLWYYYQLYNNFSKWFKEERSVFKQLIAMWVEDVLKRGVSTTRPAHQHLLSHVEDVLKRGVSTTRREWDALPASVEDVLKRGVSTTEGLLPNPLERWRTFLIERF
jgi:hypothetical protein